MSQAPLHAVTFREAFWLWVKVALYSFGGPAGQIAVMHRLLVEEKRWVSENRFLHALNYCMLLPGPEAQQLAIYIGWLLHGFRGGIVAGSLFVLPGFLSILILSILYASFQEMTLVQALFFGLKPAVLAIVMEAVLRIGRRALKNGVMVALAVLAFIAIFFFDVPFPLIVLTAALVGYIGGRVRGESFYLVKEQAASEDGLEEWAITDAVAARAHPSLAATLGVLLFWLTLWWGPILLLWLWLGKEHVLVQEGLFFSQTSVVTFGGAYAVLAYIAQEAVSSHGWLRPGEMLDGLGMAETTPGPLIQVVQFVGFLGAYRNPGSFDPLIAGILGSVVTAWSTFTPCFLWIFLGAPYIEALRGNKQLSAALSTITAAVVGVILNLAVWFALHTLFGVVNEQQVGPLRLDVPLWQSVDLASLTIALVAFLLLFRLKQGMFTTLGVCTLLGMVLFFLFRP